MKALALGAKACMLGRAWGYAVAAGGEAVVAGQGRRIASADFLARLELLRGWAD